MSINVYLGVLFNRNLFRRNYIFVTGITLDCGYPVRDYILKTQINI
jgi:hypothetical protein